MVRAMGRSATVLVLAVVVFALTPLAHACPTDPTWIGGFYDDNDYDDVVLFITGSLTAVTTDVVDPIGPAAISLGQVDPGRPHTVPVRPLASLSTRAPPLSLS
jgi:hypothetical protein